MEVPLPSLIAHRGASEYAPENTTAALSMAKRLFAKWVECDVTLSADGIAIIFHDSSLERTTNGSGLVSQTTYNTLATLDAGSWFDPEFSSARIPTLREYVELASTLSMGINIELKPTPGWEMTLAQTVVKTLQQCWPPSQPLPLLSSFSKPTLLALSRCNSPYPLAYNVEYWQPEEAAFARQLGCFSIHLDKDQINADRLKHHRDLQLKTLAYTLTSTEQAQRLLAAGVSAVFCDDPLLLPPQQ